jgi:serine/threonine-protein kinase
VISQSPSGATVVAKRTRVSFVVSEGPASTALVNVEGLPSSQAVARLRAAGFKPATSSQPSSTVAAGHAINTDPAAGTVVQVGSPVTVFVSSGPAPVHVPDVTGQTQSAAERALTGAGLAVGTVTHQPSSTQTAGDVISQSPSGGSSVPTGSNVDLTVAQASNEASVPSVVGKNEALAAAALGGAGFTPRTVNQATTDPAKVGIVLRQSPAGGRRARKGATVTISVGIAGTPTTTTPTPTPTTTTPTTTTGATPPAGAPAGAK